MKTKHLLLALLLAAALLPRAATAQTPNLYTSYTATAGVTDYTPQGYPYLVDSNNNTKWCVGNFSGPNNLGLYIEFYSAEPIIPSGYVLTTADDNATWHGRNPKDWTIKAKANPNDEWTTIATVTNDQVLQDVNLTDFAFSVDNPNQTAYQYFRFDVTAIQSGGCFQLAELRFVVVDEQPNAQAQTTETIGTGTSTTAYVFPGASKYRYTVSLYRPNEVADCLNHDFDLSSIAYDVVRYYSATIDELTFWVKDVDESDYENQGYLWYTNTFSQYIEGATQVYSTQTPFNLTEGWNTFNFTTNFSHQAGKALLVAVRGVCNNNNSSSNPYCHGHNTIDGASLWYQQSNSTDPGLDTPGYNTSSERANIQLGVTYSNAFPSDLTVTYPTCHATEVTLGWTENGEATAWQICLNDDEANLIAATTNPFTLTNLTPETPYTAKVRSNYGDTQSSWSSPVSFIPTFKTLIGTGGEFITVLPSDPSKKYSLTQQIYTPAELGTAADIASINFYNQGDHETTRNLQIYMTHTDQNEFSNWLYDDWIGVASGDLVFSGTVNFVKDAWTSIVLDTPFSYNGTQNVVITVDDNTGTAPNMSFYGDYLFLCYGSQSYQTKFYAGYDNYDPTNNPGDATSTNHLKNHIRVLKVQPPTGLTVSNITSESATLSWTDNGCATAWQICLNGDETNLIDVTENPYTLTNLTCDATYTAKVRPNYGIAHNDWSNEVSFKIQTIIYAEDFENGCDGWQFIQSMYNHNKWYWGTAAHNGEGTHSIYISDDNGATNHYNSTNMVTSLGFAAKSFDFEANTTYNFSYDWRNVGQNNDLIRVFLMPATENLTPSTVKPSYMAFHDLPEGWIELDGGWGLHGTADWRTESHDVVVPTTGSWKIVFIWYNDHMTDYNPPAAIDNLYVGVVRRPTNLHCTATTATTATLAWTENGLATNWEISIDGDESNPISANSNPFTITGLTINNTYTAKVRALTSNGATTWSDEISFLVATPLPYSTDFEASCDWIIDNTIGGDGVNGWAWGTATSNGGTHSLYVSNDGGTHYQYTSQEQAAFHAYKYFWFEAGVYHISFDWKGLGVWDLDTGEMVDYLNVYLEDRDNYIYIYRIYRLGKQGSWQTVSVDVNVSTAGAYQLWFEWMVTAPAYGYSGTGLPAAIDNVSITQVGGFKPTDLQCTATNTQAILGWTENNSNATGWQICLNGDESNLIAATTNPYTLTNLTTDATYTAKVRSITPSGAGSWSDEISFVPTIKTVIGSGTETSIALPFANHLTGLQTQQIYTADELGAAGDILNIEFFKTGTATCNRNLDIYMAHTTTNQYTTADDWVNTSEGQLVFSGTVSFADNAWTTITLSTPFHYDGQQNIALTVIDNTETAGEEAGFLCYTAPEKQNIIFQSLTAYLGYDKSQIRMLKSAVHTAVTGYGTGDGNWQLIASPLAGTISPVESTNMLCNEYDLYRFNHSAALEWENWKSHADNDGHYHFNLESGCGYLYANSEDVTLVFSGTPYSGTGEVTLSKANTRLGQWNLIGNPLGTNATLGSKPFYIMNEYGTEIITADNDHNVIAPMQGIFVEANEEGEIVTFTPQSKGADSEACIVLNLAQNSSAPIDRVIVRLGKGETLHKLQIRDGNPKIYIPQDNEEYAIVSANGHGELPVHFMTNENGTYTLSAHLEGVEMEYLHLIDNLTGADIDLLQTLEYTFTAKTTDYESRFKLVFSICGDANGDNETFAFIDADGNIVIDGIDGNATVQVIDVMGRVIVCRDAIHRVSTNGFVPGVYVIRLIDGERVRTQKMVIR